MDAAQAAFWEAVIGWIPQIVGAIALAILAFLGLAVTRLNNASREGVAVVERIKRSGVKITPVEQKAQAVKHTRNTMGFGGSLLPKALIAARVQDVVDSGNAMLKAKSDPPISDGSAQESLPRRSPTGFSGDKFQAVHVAAETMPPPIPRPSGEIESWGEIDLPKDDATLDATASEDEGEKSDA